MEKCLGHSSESPTIPRNILRFFFFFHSSLCGERAGKPGDLSYWVLTLVTPGVTLSMVRMLLVLGGGMDKVP